MLEALAWESEVEMKVEEERRAAEAVEAVAEAAMNEARDNEREQQTKIICHKSVSSKTAKFIHVQCI